MPNAKTKWMMQAVFPDGFRMKFESRPGADLTVDQLIAGVEKTLVTIKKARTAIQKDAQEKTGLTE